MGSQDKSRNSNNPMQRVKVYRLNEDGKWDDQGTGHVTVDYLERSEDLGLFVIDEEDNETLLLHRISSDDIYRKQEDTIISWRVPEFSTELALSFQETTGCSYLWDHICSLQRNMHFSSLANHKHDVQFCPADDGVESVSIVAEAEPCNHSAADLKKKEVAKGSKEGKCETGLNVTFLDLQSHFGHKRKDAAKKLGVSESTFKRLCRKYGIQRWPQNEKYKKNPSLFMTEIANQSGWDSQPNMNGLPNSTILPPPDMSQTEPKSSQHRITQPNVDVVVIYAKYESKTIKFKLCHTAGMEKLLSEVAMRLKMEVGSFEMEYLDEINEKILLTCDTDLELCLESVAAEGKCYIQISSLKNPTVMGKPCIQVVPPSSTPSSSAAAYIHHFPSCFHSYVLGVKNVVGDGHCGFRVVANLLGFGEESWGQVRRDLIDELRLNQQLYTSVFIENDAVEKILQILQCFDERASNAHWFTLPEMGYLVASTYNVALVSLSTNTNKCSTFLPLRTVVPCNLRCICIGLVYNVHFVQVFQCDGHPLPHVLAKWHECRYPEAAP